jgi:hypothetical protein
MAETEATAVLRFQGLLTSAAKMGRGSRQKPRLLPAATKLPFRKKRLGDFFPMD